MRAGPPGGNITGLARLSPELVRKNLQLLVEMVPKARRIAMLASPSGALTAVMVKSAQQAAQSRGFAFQVVELRALTGLEAAFAALKDGRAEALIVPGDGIFSRTVRSRRTDAGTAFTGDLRPGTEHVEAGGLLSYSPSSAENYRRAAGFIDKICAA